MARMDQECTSILKFDVMTARMYVVVTLTHDTMMKTGQDICGSHCRPSDQLLSENITQDWFPIPILQKVSGIENTALSYHN